MTTPTGPGLFRFKGWQCDKHKNHARDVQDVVEVQRVYGRGEYSLQVAFFGKAERVPLDRFIGEWELILVKFERD